MITIAELKTALGTKATLLVSDLTDPQIQTLIDEQEAIITDILDTIPEDVPALIKKICKDFCKYELYQREARTDVPENIAKQYNNGFKLLEKIQKGEIMFGTAEVTDDDKDAVFTANVRVFSQSL